ncbi:hypothetical protein O9K63_00785 [Janibacter cremeus]|uniref:hypothetical protein n=1 Tax=Janibacter cremeus TaxID=1285192 RepID=UPI0023F633C5|nr:hypothetical protein [Janibacter cremeus]WEV78361.1 hypothetical protein O9K63_00785 [Janibacter cremeus]
MPRSNRRRRDAHRPLRTGAMGSQTTQSWMGRSWVVRQLSGHSSTRSYTCPGCTHEIVPGTPHVVVWPDDGLGGVDDRRHWHGKCWKARDHGRYGR